MHVVTGNFFEDYKTIDSISYGHRIYDKTNKLVALIDSQYLYKTNKYAKYMEYVRIMNRFVCAMMIIAM